MNKIIVSRTNVSLITLDGDMLIVAKHDDAEERYVVRDTKFLGRFNSQDQWEPDSKHPRPPTEQDLTRFLLVFTKLTSNATEIWNQGVAQ